MQTINASARLSHQSDGMVELTIRDQTSGVLILKMDLDAEQYLFLHSSRAAEATAEVQNAAYYANVGKSYVVKSVEVPVDLLERIRYGIREVTPEMEEYAIAYRNQHGYTSHRWNHHNYGWGLIVARYEDIEAGE